MGHTRIIGKEKKEAQEYGELDKEKPVKACRDCFWFLEEDFSERYPKFYCLKWDVDTHPERSSCRYCLRRTSPKHGPIIDIVEGNIIETKINNKSNKKDYISYWLSMFPPKIREFVLKENPMLRTKFKENSKSYEDYAYVLDFLPNGQREPLAQVIGEKYFTLLEVSIKKGANPFVMDRLYIGKGERDTVNKVKRKLRFDQLTSTAKSNLPYVLEHIVKRQEKRFVEFFNRVDWINSSTYIPCGSRGLHTLHLLAFVNNNVLENLIKEREKEPFKSFGDIMLRAGLNPIRAIVNRIICELRHTSKYLLFVKY
jgi:putative nucleotide binding protein